MPDGSPCWCVSEQEVPGDWVHSPRCMALRALSGGYDFADLPPNKGPLRNATQRQKKSAFLREYANHGILTHAAEAVGVERSTVGRWQEADPVFAEAMAWALEQAVDLAERELIRRGREGVVKPVYQGGKLVGTVREYSDTLLLAYLNAHGTGRGYSRNRVEVTGANGGPIQSQVVPMVSGLDDHEKRALRKVIEQALREREGAAEPTP